MPGKEAYQPQDAQPFVSHREKNQNGQTKDGSCTGGSSGSCGACGCGSCACGTGGGECGYLPIDHSETEDR